MKIVRWRCFLIVRWWRAIGRKNKPLLDDDVWDENLIWESKGFFRMKIVHVSKHKVNTTGELFFGMPEKIFQQRYEND
jgi:hypothetical protein